MSERQFIYGINPVKEALRGNRSIYEVFIYKGRNPNTVKSIIELCKRRGIKVSFVERSFFSSFPKAHQGIAALTESPPSLSIEDLFEISHQKGEPAFYLVIDSVQDPRNLGAILRTAEVAGVHGVVLPKKRIARGETVEKASAGAMQHLPIVNVPNIKHALSKFRERGITVYAAEADGQILYWEADMTGPLTILIGSEGEGIKKTVKSYADSVITIPVRGKINSLNVSVATGIILYEVLRQRRKI